MGHFPCINFNFDLGINSNKPNYLNGLKSKPLGSASSYGSSGHQSGRPSWTHQPLPTPSSAAGSLNGPASLVGDIFGKSWSSVNPGTGGGIGIAPKDPSLFGDLVGSALGQGKSRNIGGGGGGISGNGVNGPLKNVGGVPNKSAYSMGNLADSLPETGNSGGRSGVGGNWGLNNSSDGYSSNSYGTAGGIGVGGVNTNGGNVSNNVNLGGTAMKNMAGRGGSSIGRMSMTKDLFDDLSGFGSKDKPVDLSSTGKGRVQRSVESGGFGDFQNAMKSSPESISSSFDVKFDDFGIPAKDFWSQNQIPIQEQGVGNFDSIFSSSDVSGGQQSAEMDDWGLDSGLGGGNDGGSTTELEGLLPPPAGVSASTSKSKGMDNYKQGQYADAIKWLSWAVILLERDGDSSVVEVLSCRASCYKEVGEYKKAVADCSKEKLNSELPASWLNTLMRLALCYAGAQTRRFKRDCPSAARSMEKYRLGAEDLRTVLRIDPGNRVARTTVHRLTKMAD